MNDETKGGWWVSHDGEIYTDGPYETRAAAILAGGDLHGGDEFYILEGSLTSKPFSLNAERVLEDQYFENDNLFSFVDDGTEPDRRGKWAEADKELQELLDGWLTKHRKTFVEPTVFAWTRNEEEIPAGAVSGEISA